MADKRVTVVIAAVINDFKNKMKEVRNQMEETTSKMKSAGDKISSVGQGFTNAGKQMSVAVSAPLIAVGTLAFKAASDFETAFAGVRKTVDASEAEFAALEKGIRDMAKEIPASANEIAGVAEAAGQLGIAKENIMSFSRTMIDLGVATNMTSDEAATQLARLANITQMPQTEFSRLGSSVVALGNTMATTEGEIVSMSLRLAAQGSQVGMTEAQITGLAAAMSSVGIEAEAGGTAMSMVLKKMQSAVMGGGKELEFWADVAKMSAKDFKKAFEEDATSALDALIKGLAASGAEGENLTDILNDLGIKGIRESDTMLRLAGASDLLAGAVETATTAWDENNALSNEAAERYKTTESQLQIMKNTLTDLGIVFGSIIIPMVLSFLQTAIMPLVQWMANLDESTAKIIVVIGGLAAAIGPVLIVLGTLIGAIGSIVGAVGPVLTALKGLGAAMSVLTGPIGIVIAAIGALVAAFVVLYNKNETFREFVDKTWGLIKDTISSALNFIKDTTVKIMTAVTSFFSAELKKIKDFWKQNGEGISQNFKFVFEGIYQFIKINMAAMKAVFQAVWPAISGIVRAAWETIKAIISSAVDIMLGLIKVGMQVMTGDWTGAWNTIKDTVKKITENIKTLLKNVDLKQIGKDMIRGLVNGIKGMMDTVKNAVSSLAKLIPDWAKKKLGISSPSKVADKEVGRPVGGGVASGLDRSRRIVAKSAKALASAAIPDLDRMDFMPSFDYQDTLKKTTGFARGILGGQLDAELSHDGYTEEADRSGDLVLMIDGYELARIQRSHLDQLNGSAFNLRMAAKGG